MIHFEKVNIHNVWKLLELEVEESQRSFVATNTESIVEAYTTITSGGVALPFGIYDGETPVGFIMFGYGPDAEAKEQHYYDADSYSIWRLMIDRRYQNRGYGKQVMQLALDYIRTYPCGPAGYVILSYEPENEHAKKMYADFGFRETGDWDEGEIIAIREI